MWRRGFSLFNSGNQACRQALNCERLAVVDGMNQLFHFWIALVHRPSLNRITSTIRHRLLRGLQLVEGLGKSRRLQTTLTKYSRE
jgi:hypothetical protein